MERTTLASRGVRAATGSSHGRRRRLVAGLLLLGIGIPAASTLAGNAGAAATPSRDIWSYAVFGWNSVSIKGQGASINGNVGVNNAGGTVGICQNGTLTMGAGSQLVGDNLKISNLCNLYDVFYGHQPNLSGVSYHSAAQFTPPINPTNVPAFPTNNCDPSKPITVQDGTVLGKGILNSSGYLPPGVYGDVNVKDPVTFFLNKLSLTSGTYVFCNVTVGKSAWLDFAPDATIIVNGTFSISNNSALGHGPQLKFGGFGDTSNALMYVRGDKDVTSSHHCRMSAGVPLDCATGAHVNLSKHTEIHATIFAQNGQLNLGHDTDLYGRFWAYNVISDVATRISVPSGPPPSVTTTTSSLKTTSSTSTSTSTSSTSTSSTSTSTSSTSVPPKPTTTTSTTIGT